MEKQINISSNLTVPEKKNTKKNSSNKEHINSILEKYNLKAPKTKQNKQQSIKPAPPPQKPATPPIITPPKPVPPPQKPVPPPQKPEPPQKPAPPIIPPQKSAAPNIIPQKPATPPNIIPQKNNNLSLNNLLNKDKKELSNEKLIMPKAIISKNHPKDFLNSDNIYNIIPTVNSHKKYSHLDTSIKNQQKDNNNHTINNHNINNNVNNNVNIKKININPNLTESDSQIYKGTNKNQDLYKENQNLQAQKVQQQQLRQEQLRQEQLQQHKLRQQQLRQQEQNNNNTNGRVIRRQSNNTHINSNIQKKIDPQIEIQSNSNNINNIKSIVYKNNKNNKTNIDTTNSTEINSPIINENSALNNLELQRQYLQEQQKKELEKLKFKKEQIMKIHNRKKEIELMKSIETEKHKLRFIQTKQEELNKLIHNQSINDTINNTINDTINNTRELNLNKTQKQYKIYNVDEKKTKKNMSLINNSKNVIDVVKQPTIITKTKVKENSREANSREEPAIETIHNKEQNQEHNIEKTQDTSKEETIENTSEKENTPEIENTNKIKNEDINIKKNIKKINKKNENEPYTYYYKKDIEKLNLNVYWGTNAELYNTDTFTEPLTLLLKIQPLFNTTTINKLNNDTKTLDNKVKILKNIYNFKNINKFKDTIINLIYKIMVYDTIFTECNF